MTHELDKSLSLICRIAILIQKMTKSFYIVILCILRSMATSQEIGCYVEGDCSGDPVRTSTIVGDSIGCHVLCEEEVRCKYWTFYGDNSSCLLFSRIWNLGSTPNTISGEVSIHPLCYSQLSFVYFQWMLNVECSESNDCLLHFQWNLIYVRTWSKDSYKTRADLFYTSGYYSV